MVFDWADYLALARRLAGEPSEASHRSAISRAYYSVYHSARLFLVETESFQTSTGAPVHAQLWKAFRNKGATYNAIGLKGDRLRVNRTQADYDQEILKLRDLLDDSLAEAEKILGYLTQLKTARRKDSAG